MNKTPMLIAAALFATAAGLAQAAPHPPGLQPRANQQQARINQGVADGSLTHREAARLQMRQDHLRHDMAVARADGVVTPAERMHLIREENANSRAIWRQRHDAQQR